MGEVFFHARLVLTVCVSNSWLHYVTSHGLCFTPSGTLSCSYVNNVGSFACKVMKEALKWTAMFELSHTGLSRVVIWVYKVEEK